MRHVSARRGGDSQRDPSGGPRPLGARSAEPFLAQLEQPGGARLPFGELRAEINVAGESQERVGPHGRTRRLTRELDEAVFQRSLSVRQRARISASAHTLLRDVADAVADIERRVALAVEIEVEEIEALSIDQRVVGVEVAMDAAEPPGRCRAAEPVAEDEQPLEPRRPLRTAFRQGVQALVLNTQLVSLRVLACRRDIRAITS